MTVSRDGTWPASSGVVGARVSPVALVGRDDQLVEVRGLLGDVVAGRGGVVWVEGEPGVGKSALIAAGLAEAHRLGCQVFWGSASELQLVPLQVLLDALRVERGSVDGLRAPVAALLRGDGLAGVATPRDVAAMVAEQILILVDRLCAAGPVVAVLDDAQWADEVSLSVWSRLATAAVQVPLLLIGARRPVPQRAAVEALRRDLVGLGGTVIQLDGLPPDRVAEMVHWLVAVGPDGRLGQRLGAAVEQAAGNPLYVRELVDALLLDGRIRVEHGVAELVGDGRLPGSLPAAIGRRLGFLSEPARSVLQMAALLGPAFTVTELGVVTGRPATELVAVVQEALASGVLTEAEDRLVFRHGLIRHALYEAMPISLRAALHRQAAQALAGAGAPGEQVAEQLLAGPVAVDGWMIDWAAGAAAALTLRAPRLAVDLLRRVRDRVDGGDPRRERLDTDLAEALFVLGDHDAVEPLADPVLAATRDPALAARMAWTLAYTLMRTGRAERAAEMIDQTMARTQLPEIWTARLHALQAVSLTSSGHYDEARAAAMRAEADGHRLGDRLAIGYALHAQAWLASRQDRDVEGYAQIVDRALTVLGDDPQATDLRLLLLSNAARGRIGRGPPAEAEGAYGRAVMLAEQAGTPARLAVIRLSCAEAHLAWGRWDEALADLQDTDDVPLDTHYQLIVRGVRALIAVHRDDRAAADAQLRGVEDLKLASAQLRSFVDFLVDAWALAAERDGQPTVALTRLLNVLDPRGTRRFTELTVDSWRCVLDVVRLALTVGDQATAAAAARACAAEADRRPQSHPVTAATQHCQGLLERDPARVREAADMFQRIGYSLPQAQALEDAAVLYAEHGDPHPAQTAYLAAIDIYTDLDAAWDIIRADARLRPHNIRRGRRGPRHPKPTTGWESLTPTERKIAQLVAAKYSNPDIAAELFLSRRTVETHVAHILTKLNAHSRRDIVREYASATKLS